MNYNINVIRSVWRKLAKSNTRFCHNCQMNVYKTRWDHHRTWCHAEPIACEFSEWPETNRALAQLRDNATKAQQEVSKQCNS